MSNKYPGGIISTGVDTGYSVFFDGAEDYLTVPSNAAFGLGTGDWTIECFFNTSNSAKTNSTLIDFRASGGGSNQAKPTLIIQSRNLIYLASGATRITTPVSSNQWYHVAVCKASGFTKMYLNGVQVGATYTDSINYGSSNDVVIGETGDNRSFDGWFVGYMSNIRIVKGSAVYTANFAPPTQLLPIASTQLLTCQSPAIVDNSGNNRTITVNGNAAVSNFTPFTGFKSGVDGFDPSLGSAAPGIWTIDQATAYQTNRQWPIYDPYFNQTTLLLQGENPISQTDPTWLTDASTNNLNLNVVGDAKASSQTPYATNFSNFFNGTTDYLTTTASALNYVGSGDFTVEAWVKVLNVSSLQTLVSYGTTAGMFRVFINNDTVWVLNGGTSITSSSGASVITLNEWNHIAVVRSGVGSDNVKVYVNGELKLQGTSATDFNAGSTLSIGAESGSNFFSGYISNLRILPGTALYTSNFPVPNSPLTAVSGTVLLTAQSNRFKDNSTANSGNPFDLTINGFPTIEYHNPFNNNSFTGGSGYFDGTGDFLSTNSTTVQPGSGNFTFECWLYPSVTQPNNAGIFSTGTSGGLQLSYYLTTGLGIASSGVGFVLNSTSERPIVGAWNHVVFCRGGTGAGQTSIYLNGKRIANGQVSTNFSNGVMNLGYQGSGTSAFFHGYIAQVRYVNSDVYGHNNTSITVPTAPLAPISGTQLLTLQSPTATNNKLFLDSSYNNLPVVNFGGVTQGSFSPFSTSGWSTFLEGSISTVFGNGESHLALGTNNFCIEMWVYPTSDPSTNQILWDQRPASTSGAYVTLYRVNNGTVEFFVNSSVRIASTLTVPLNRWTHIALERVSGVTSLYINGVAQYQKYADTTSYLNGANRPSIGRSGFSAASYFAGHISSVRVTSSPSSFVYNGNFTPSSQPFIAASNTRFLAFQTNNYSLDQSPNITTLQTLGSPKSTPFSPFIPTYTVPSTYSYGFNGATSNLFCSASASPLGVEPFTYEGFIYARAITSNSTTAMRIFDSSNIAIAVYNTGEIIATPRAGTIVGSNLVLNTWTHVAVVKNTANVVTLYINGNVSGTTLSDTAFYQQANVVIGGANAAPTNSTFNGFISNFRLVKGSAVYTANFAPPTGPLTAITNTSLLTCQSPFIVDNSVNKFPLFERGGVTLTSSSTPFNPIVDQTTRSVYSSALVGGSASFDGSGDYLVTSNIATPRSNVAFTAEAWYYATGLASGTARILDANTFSIGVTSSGEIYGEVKNTTTTVSITGPTIFTNSWNHVALVRTGNAINNANVFLYHNGLRVGAVPNERGNLVAGGNVTIGSVGGGAAATNFKGLISGATILTNNILYSSNFIPAFAPSTVNSNTSLLLDFADAGITDITGKNTLDTVANVGTSSAVTKFGRRSLRFDGANDFINVTSNTLSGSFNTGGWTAEFWVYPITVANRIAFLDTRRSSTSNFGVSIFMNATGTLGVQTGSNLPFASTTSTLVANVWQHIAVCSSNIGSAQSITLFLNGSNIAAGTYTNNLTDTVLNIGRAASGSSPLSFHYGFMDELRITKGVARYTGNFTPQTSAWQNQ